MAQMMRSRSSRTSQRGNVALMLAIALQAKCGPGRLCARAPTRAPAQHHLAAHVCACLANLWAIAQRAVAQRLRLPLAFRDCVFNETQIRVLFVIQGKFVSSGIKRAANAGYTILLHSASLQVCSQRLPRCHRVAQPRSGAHLGSTSHARDCHFSAGHLWHWAVVCETHGFPVLGHAIIVTFACSLAHTMVQCKWMQRETRKGTCDGRCLVGMPSA